MGAERLKAEDFEELTDFINLVIERMEKGITE